MVSLLGEIVVLTHQDVFFSRENGSLNNQNDDVSKENEILPVEMVV
jgi:hypothetical protein